MLDIYIFALGTKTHFFISHDFHQRFYNIFNIAVTREKGCQNYNQLAIAIANFAKTENLS